MADFGMTLLSYLLPVIAAVLTGLISWGLSKLFKKWGIDLDLTKDATVRSAIRTAISGAEEWSERKLKIEGKKPEGAEKAKWVHAQVSRMWPKLLPNDLDGMIDEELSLMSGVGATGDRVIGARLYPPVGALDGKMPLNETTVEQ
jgi:hypothetical protein